MKAVVVFFSTGTAAATPTDAVPDTAIAPEMMSSVRVSFAAMRALPPATTIVREVAHAASLGTGAPHTSPMKALVVIVCTETAALTAIAAVPAKLPPAETLVRSSLEVASTATSPSRRTSACGAIHACVLFVMTCTSAPAPTPGRAADRELPGDRAEGRVVGGAEQHRRPAAADRVDGGAAVDVRVGGVVLHADRRGAGDADRAAERAGDRDEPLVLALGGGHLQARAPARPDDAVGRDRRHPRSPSGRRRPTRCRRLRTSPRRRRPRRGSSRPGRTRRSSSRRAPVRWWGPPPRRRCRRGFPGHRTPG